MIKLLGETVHEARFMPQMYRRNYPSVLSFSYSCSKSNQSYTAL
jgi:hypothetical protein